MFVSLPHRTPTILLPLSFQQRLRATVAAREWAKQKRVAAAIQSATADLPPPMDLRGNHDGSPEYTTTGRVSSPFPPRTQNAFAVVYLKGHQYKITADDVIYADKMEDVDVNDEVTLHRVLLWGSPTTTVVGRPVVPGVEVRCVVEEQFMDGKRVTFKFKRRKSYKRMKGARLPMTALRVVEIVGEGVEVEGEATAGV